MKELSFAQNFSIIALNAQDSLRLTNAKKVSLRCMAAATILELFLKNSYTRQGEALVLNKKELECPSIQRYQKTVVKALLGNSEEKSDTLPNYLMKVTKLSNKILKEIEYSFANSLIAEKALEEIPALLGCDLEYVTAGISMREYRSNSELYSRLTESLRAEILEDGPMTDDAILMFWLLRESGCMNDLFSKEELKRIAERVFELVTNSSLANQVFLINIHKTMESGIKNFLKLKKEAMSTPFGSGINFIFPVIERSQSIFIDTEEFFASKEARLRDVITRLENHGHTYTVIREGEVPLIKIDNVLYEAVPYAKQYEMPVHGVQLRRHPLSL